MPIPPSLIVQEEVQITEPVPDARIGIVLHDRFISLPSPASARKALRREQVYKNGELATWRDAVQPGDRITLTERPVRPGLVAREIALEIAYEDDHLAVIDKPAGLLVNGFQRHTLEAGLPHALAPTSRPDALAWPRPVHRLDGRTSGLVVVAKTASALVDLGRQFQERVVQKSYRAIVSGRLEGEGEVREPLGGREAHTSWRALEHTRSLKPGWMTTVELQPHTGRTHQLRLHMAHLGHPILGDGRYGDGLRGRGLFLQARELTLRHPHTQEPLHVVISELARFQTHRAREARRWARHFDEDGRPLGS